MPAAKHNEIVYQNEFEVGLRCINCDDIFIISPSCLEDIRIRGWSKANNGYVFATFNYKAISLHRYLLRNELSKPENFGLVVDHINRNKLDNRLENLRIVSHRTNTINSINSINAINKVFGVRDQFGVYTAYIEVNGEPICLGSYEDKYIAGLVFDRYIVNNLPEKDLDATNIRNGNIPQYVLDKYNIDINDLTTIPYFPSRKYGANNFYGVSYQKKWGVYVASIRDENKKTTYLGGFKTEIEAAAAREEFLLNNPKYLEFNTSNILRSDNDNLINIAYKILTKNELEEATRGC